MTAAPAIEADTRPTRPPLDYEIEEAYVEHDRREITAILTDAGFQAATFNEVMLATSEGFFVRCDGPYRQRTGVNRVHVTFAPHHSAETLEMIQSYAAVLERAEGWAMDYVSGLLPLEGISLLRRS